MQKLIEEEAFKPKIRKSPLEMKEYALPQQKYINYNHLQTRVNSSGNLKKSSVEIVGLSKKGNQQNTIDLNEKEESLLNRLSDPDLMISSSLVPAKPHKSSLKSYENLTEKNYTQIIDNLTNRYSNEGIKTHELDLVSKELIDQKNKNKKVNTDNSNLINSLSPKSKDKNLVKSLEKNINP